MIVIVRIHDEDGIRAVTETGESLAIPASVVTASGLRRLRTGQRLVVQLTADGELDAIRLP